MKAVYPIILTPAERGYVVFVPDLDINTEGDDLADAIEMARDAIGIWGITEEDAGRKIPKASGTMPHPAERWLTLTLRHTAGRMICALSAKMLLFPRG